METSKFLAGSNTLIRQPRVQSRSPKILYPNPRYRTRLGSHILQPPARHFVLCFRYNGFHISLPEFLKAFTLNTGRGVSYIAIGRNLMWYGGGQISGEALYKLGYLKEVVIADDSSIEFSLW